MTRRYSGTWLAVRAARAARRAVDPKVQMRAAARRRREHDARQQQAAKETAA